MYKMLVGTSSPEEVRIRQSRATHGGAVMALSLKLMKGLLQTQETGEVSRIWVFVKAPKMAIPKKREWQAVRVRCFISFDHHTHIERWLNASKKERGVLWVPFCFCIFDISFLRKIPIPVLSKTKHCCFCNKSNHCAFSTALPMSYIDTWFQPKQTWTLNKNNKTNKCKCLSKECSIALNMYRLYISTGVSLSICNSSFGHVHFRQAPIYAICSL